MKIIEEIGVYTIVERDNHYLAIEDGEMKFRSRFLVEVQGWCKDLSK